VKRAAATEGKTRSRGVRERGGKEPRSYSVGGMTNWDLRKGSTASSSSEKIEDEKTAANAEKGGGAVDSGSARAGKKNLGEKAKKESNTKCSLNNRSESIGVFRAGERFRRKGLRGEA